MPFQPRFSHYAKIEKGISSFAKYTLNNIHGLRFVCFGVGVYILPSNCCGIALFLLDKNVWKPLVYALENLKTDKCIFDFSVRTSCTEHPLSEVFHCVNQ